MKKGTIIPYSAVSNSKIIFFIGSSKQRNDFDQLGFHIANSGYRRPTNPEFELKNATEFEKDPLQSRILCWFPDLGEHGFTGLLQPFPQSIFSQ